MKVTVLVGGVGGARFLLGVKAALGLPAVGPGSDDAQHQVTAVVNVGDDVWLHGLRICPDLDTCHLHPRRRHRPGARLGPRGGDVDGP